MGHHLGTNERSGNGGICRGKEVILKPKQKCGTKERGGGRSMEAALNTSQFRLAQLV
jgi:hypothetical protein